MQGSTIDTLQQILPKRVAIVSEAGSTVHGQPSDNSQNCPINSNKPTQTKIIQWFSCPSLE
eukprot:1597552-Amphidinium_carterae.1